MATLVALSLVLTVLGPVGTVAADPSVSIEQTADDTTVAPGDTVTLTTTFTAADVNGPLVEMAFPDGWEGTVTDSDGGAVRPQDDSGTLLPSNSPAVVWLSAGTYEITTTVQVPENVTPGEYTISATGSGVDPTDDDAGLVNEDDEVDTTETTITVEQPEQNANPTASFTASPSATEVGQAVSFDASGSRDDSSIVSYEWDFGDGETASGESVSNTYDVTGDYTVELTVTDDDGATDSATATVSVGDTPNQPPVAEAGDDQTVTEGGSVGLDASGSTDADGDALSYDWTQTSGPEVTLSDGTSATPTFTAPTVDADETLTFEVTVSDGETTTTDAVSVTVENGDQTDPPTDGLATGVSLSPANSLVAVGDAAEYDIVVDNAQGGVGVYSMSVTVDDPSVAAITGVDLASVTEGLTDVQISEDGSSATIEAVMVDTDDSGSVTLGTVTVESAAEGTADVPLAVSELGDESGTPYEVTSMMGASIEASTLVVGDSLSPAQDLDGDGLYEDVNGDGTVDVLDVQTLFADRDGTAVQNSPEAFDFNGDGQFSLLDIQTLFAEETE